MNPIMSFPRPAAVLLAAVVLPATGLAQPDSQDLEATADQAQAMMSVEYHFTNLWFAGRNGNWDKAGFYLDRTENFLDVAVEAKPMIELSGGQSFNLRQMLQGVRQAGINQIRSAVDQQSASAFESAYRQTMAQCTACHQAAGRPFLQPRVPDAPDSPLMFPGQ